jgi:DNA-binding NarL/FixJ family response regulator
MPSEGFWVRRAIEAGARGYILENAIDLDLVPMLKRVAAGELAFDSQISNQQMSHKLERGGSETCLIDISISN